MRLFKRVAIVGVGFIGGSLGLDLRRKKIAEEVVGFSRHRSSLILAKKKGAIDKGYEEIEKAVSYSDLVILATPVSKIIELIPYISSFLKEGAIVSDVGSTKVEIVRQGERFLSKNTYFVGAHPLAGSEKRGIREAREDLFKNAFCILTPTKNTDKKALKKILQLWKNIGAEVKIMSPQEHDRLVAKISHLPHALAVNLILSLDKKIIPWGAGGLKDTTRIALSDPYIWQDIFLTNQKEIIKAIKKFNVCMDKFLSALQNKDIKFIFSLLRKAQEKRALLKG